MGIILLPFFVASLIFTVIVVIRLVKYINIKQDYLILFFGFLISIIEIVLIVYYWKQQDRIYYFTPVMESLSYLVIFPSIISLIIPLRNDTLAKKVGLAVSSSVVISFVLLILYTFVFSNFIGLGLSTYK